MNPRQIARPITGFRERVRTESYCCLVTFEGGKRTTMLMLYRPVGFSRL